MERKLTAMIPARLGSKRIPKKNIRYMGEKPLIRYPIDLALQCDRFEEIWLNSESRELGAYAEAAGIRYHERPAWLAGDQATNREFTYEFLEQHDCDYVIMINPTSPLLRVETLQQFLDFTLENRCDTVLSVISEQEETFYRGEPLNFSYEEKKNSQLLEPVEKIVWSMTAWKRDTFLRLARAGSNPVFGGSIGRFPIPKDESCDLDTPEDWRIAEGILLAREEQQNRKERYMEL